MSTVRSKIRAAGRDGWASDFVGRNEFDSERWSSSAEADNTGVLTVGSPVAALPFVAFVCPIRLHFFAWTRFRQECWLYATADAAVLGCRYATPGEAATCANGTARESIEMLANMLSPE